MWTSREIWRNRSLWNELGGPLELMGRRQLLAAGSAAAGLSVLPGTSKAGVRSRFRSLLNERISRYRLRAALARGFGIQYWGAEYSASELALAPHGLLILEASRTGADDNSQEVSFDAAEIQEIRRSGARPVIGYLNVTEIETYRNYWRERDHVSDIPTLSPVPDWVGPVTRDGEQLAAYWLPAWERILKTRIDGILGLGFDGVFLDDVLHYFSYLSGDQLRGTKRVPTSGEGGYATAMMHLIIRLATYIRTRRPDAIVVANNGIFLAGDSGAEIGGKKAEALFKRYSSALDGILVESAFGADATAQVQSVLTERYLESGVSVLTVDFASQLAGPSNLAIRMAVESQAKRAGFVPYVADNEVYDRLYRPFSP